MIPEPSLRSGLTMLLQQPRVKCTSEIVALVKWMNDDTEDGGWRLKPYIPITWVSLTCDHTAREITPQYSRTDLYSCVPAAQDQSDEEFEGDFEIPMVRDSWVAIGQSARSRHSTCLRHWCSTTPEVQVLSLANADRVGGWLAQEGVLSPEDVSVVSESMPLVRELMMSDAVHDLPRTGHFWQLSDNLQEVLTRMVKLVHRTFAEETEDIDAWTDSTDALRHATYRLPVGARRTEPTALEQFLWVSAVPTTYRE